MVDAAVADMLLEVLKKILVAQGAKEAMVLGEKRRILNMEEEVAELENLPQAKMVVMEHLIQFLVLQFIIVEEEEED
jgi:hypothetical protein